MFDNLNPVGTIKVNSVANGYNPGFGIWELIGQLKNGQTIIGGYHKENYSEAIKSHTHDYTVTADDSKKGYYTGSVKISDRKYQYIDSSNSNQRSKFGNFTIKNTGGTNNEAYGLGIGSKYIWERIG